MSLANFLNHAATLQSPTYDSDDSAGIKRWEDPTDVLTDEPVRVEDASAREVSDYGMRNIEITHRVFTTSTSPQNGYRWSYDDRYYIVKDILRRRGIGGIDNFYVNMCQEIAPNG